MPKVSVLLSCARRNFLDACLDDIRANAGMDDYEIVIVSPFPVEGDKVRWIEETEKKGNVAANNLAYDAASGDIVVQYVDYLVMRRNALANVVSFIEHHEADIFPFCAGLFFVEFPVQGTAQALRWLGPRIGTSYGRYYPYFAAATRRSYEAAGGFMSTKYYGSFADPDLGMRFWHAGGQCRPCWDAVVMTSPYRVRGDGQDAAPGETSKDTFLMDLGTFIGTWKKVFGEAWGSQFRQFNIDIPACVVERDEDVARLHDMMLPPASEDGFQIRLRNGEILTFPRISF